MNKVNLDNDQESSDFYKRVEKADEVSIKKIRMKEKGDNFIIETLVELKETKPVYSCRISNGAF